MEKKVEFLMKEVPGKELPSEYKVKCKYRNMVSLSKIFGIRDEKFMEPE